MDKWSPQDAMNAYLHTLHLCQSNEYGNTTSIEPKCMEFISALAAGKRAKIMVEITTEGITPLTIALAVAAKHTGGKLICIISPHQQNFKTTSSQNLHNLQHLQDVIEFVHGNPLQLVKELKKVDLLVIDGRLEDQIKLIKVVDFNENGCDIVGHNMHYRRNCLISFGEVLSGKKGVEYKTMAIGDGIELTRIGCMSKVTRRYRRFHVTFENY
ncbi:uncharacterized protein [Euphorbia lathyris]|uniref:uncharacterized protein n=1 Tax=Euphorbia lathyris TaxID=212925 RepID=UPI0033133AA2